jgi:CubicO group peptidase (beta-lactamase class C family)
MLTRRPVLLGLGAALAAWKISAQEPPAVAGTWTGALEIGSQRLRLKFEIASDGSTTLRSLDQGGAPIPAKATSLTAERIEIEVGAVRGSFRGRMVSADRIEGTWRQGGELPLVLLRGEAGLNAAGTAVEALSQQGLEKLQRESGVPALAAAAVMKGKAAQQWSAGERASGSSVAVTQKDLWHLGSITKSMTATLVARLVESGEIKWGDTVGAVLGTVVPDMHEAYKSVSFRHLACHRAGLPGNIPMDQFVAFPRDSEDARDDRREFARIALKMAPIGPKESTFTYSNNGFVIIGAMLEAKLGKPWEALIRTHVFEPLKLGSAGFGAPGRKGELSQPAGHVFNGKSLIAMRVGEGVTDNPAVLGPAGRVHMAFDDVLTYLAAHRDGTAFLKAESWKALHTPPFGGEYAMGWVQRGDGALWHNGSNTMWFAEVLFNSTSGVAAVAACNEGRPSASVVAGQTLLRAARAVA